MRKLKYVKLFENFQMNEINMEKSFTGDRNLSKDGEFTIEELIKYLDYLSNMTYREFLNVGLSLKDNKSVIIIGSLDNKKKSETDDFLGTEYNWKFIDDRYSGTSFKPYNKSKILEELKDFKKLKMTSSVTQTQDSAGGVYGIIKLEKIN